MNQKSEYDIYIGKMDIENLYNIHRISYIKEEDFNDLSKDWKIESAVNLNFEAKQRDESPKRIKSIAKYIDTDLWIFPNAIILWNVEWNKWLTFIENNQNNFFELSLSLKNEDEKLFVIDWQHRLKWAALNYYSNVLLKIKEYFINDRIEILDLNKIDKITNPIDKVNEIKKFYHKNKTKEITNIVEKLDVYELPIVIIDKISNSKIIEIFTDINGLVVPLTSNHIRFNYWFFTNKQPPKFDLLNISVNLCKLLNDNKKSALYGLVKMPYKVSYYENNLKWYSQVSLSAFCQRFEERWKLDIKKDKSEYDFYNKTLWIFIYHQYLTWNINQKLPINESSIIESINFLFLIFSYSYIEIKNIFDIWIENKIKKEGEFEKDFKFLSSTSNELYFFVIEYLLVLLILEYDYNIDKVFNLSKTEIEESIHNSFKKIKVALENTFEENKFFKKGTQLWTWQSASSKVIKYFINQVEKTTNIWDLNFMNKFNEKMNKIYFD